MTPPRETRILIATGNPAKAREIEAVLREAAAGAPPVAWMTLRDFPGIPEPHEDGESFAENAALKARYYSKIAGLWTLADDSGLEVDALGGRPGVYSARFAEDVADGASRDIRDAANNRKLIQLLSGIPLERRAARFRCALALADGDQILAEAQGAIEGVIIDARRGAGGFGYDPHFLVPSIGKTTAELDADHKNAISHRGQALREMCGRLHELLSRT